MRLFTLFNLLLIVCLFGCLGSQQTATQTMETETAATETEESALAVLELSTPKTTYSAQEAIPLELTIQNGKFDLLVPFSSVSTQRAFKQLTVANSNGEVFKMKKPIPLGNTLKALYEDGKSVRCVQGFDMKAGTTQTVSLENLQTHYQLEPGSYTVKVTILLEVYREFMEDQHPEIIELQREIQKYQNNTNPQFTPEVKKEAIEYTQGQIDLIKEKYKEELQNIYLPLKSLRGKASLESNSISLAIK
ncbi:hypothetical protein C6501_19285 [Candidatus Poribacteria bacterium]|nr:MAG: hypothetical protein C6501_19285 [Candidatus Poribacteria bacterium]